METVENNKSKLIDYLQNNLVNDPSSADIQNTIDSFYNEVPIQKNNPLVWKSKIGRPLFIIASLFVIFTIITITYFFDDKKLTKYLDLILFCTWTIAPPVWFLYEYVKNFPDEYKLNPHMLADYKVTQELASKIWASVVVIITAIFYLKYGKNAFI